MDREFHSSNLGYETFDSFTVIGVTKKKIRDALTDFGVSTGFRAFFVTRGSATVDVGYGAERIESGDVVMLPPIRSGAVSEERHFECVKITFKGSEAIELARSFGFARRGAIFRGVNIPHAAVATLAEQSGEVLTLRAKGVIYLTLSEVQGVEADTEEVARAPRAAEKIKLYLDEFFSDPELSLKTIGAALSYHPNYISKIFNETYGMSVIRYVNIMRVRHARYLLEEGVRSLKEVAACSGFYDAEYFATVFKSVVGQTPKEYLKRISTTDSSPR